MQKTRFDISSENFDLFFASQLSKITPQAKESLPKDVTIRLFKKNGHYNPVNLSKLGFIGKLFILWKALKKRWWIVVEDEENGLTIEQFIAHKAAIKKRDYGIPKAEGTITEGVFVTASKELGDMFSYLNRLSGSPSYNYLIKGNNKIYNRTEEHKKQMQYICRFLACYESNKKAWVAEMGVSIPEWLVLIYCYHGKEIVGSIMYKEFYRRAYQSSPRKIKEAFGTLQGKGLLEKSGSGNGAKMSITPLGTDLVNSILSKYALNC